MITLNPGAISVVTARLVLPFRGVWFAELTLDPVTVALVPTSGKVAIALGQAPGPVTTLVGTIDPRGSGPFGAFYSMRVLGGGAGWDKPVARQAFATDAGVTSAMVYAATGALVGEVVSVLAPTVVGAAAYARRAGAAREILDREPEWWVDPTTGTTFVGPRPPAIPDPSMVLLSWDPAQQSAELSSDGLVMPGTPILDSRIGPTPVTARDVEQTFDAKVSRVTVWCSDTPETQLAGDLRTMVEEFSRVRWARGYLYRIVQQAPDGRLALQAVHADLGMPDMLPIPAWSGVAGASGMYTPGTTVRVTFVEGDPGQPVVDLFDATLPLILKLDAEAQVQIGGDSATPVVPTPWASGLLIALAGFASALPPGTPAAVNAAATALATALAALPPPATAKTVAA